MSMRKSTSLKILISSCVLTLHNFVSIPFQGSSDEYIAFDGTYDQSLQGAHLSISSVQL